MRAERQRGFTLVEVLIALAVLAIALAAVMRTLSQGIDVNANLRDRNLALWVAQNRLTLHQIQHDWPGTDTRDGEAEMGGRRWRWREQVAATPEPALRRIEIEVRAVADEAVLARLVGFLPQPATPR
jgi:general secretion pathway protein I